MADFKAAICRCGGTVDTNALGAFATWRAGSSPVIGTREARESKELVSRATAQIGETDLQ